MFLKFPLFPLNLNISSFSFHLSPFIRGKKTLHLHMQSPPAARPPWTSALRTAPEIKLEKPMIKMCEKLLYDKNG